MNIISDVKTLLDLDDSADAKLSILLAQAEADALMITKRVRTFGMENVIEKMVIYLWNINGTQGLTSEQYSGATYHYSNGYPEDIMAMLDNYADTVNGRGKLVTY